MTLSQVLLKSMGPSQNPTLYSFFFGGGGVGRGGEEGGGGGGGGEGRGWGFVGNRDNM